MPVREGPAQPAPPPNEPSPAPAEVEPARASVTFLRGPAGRVIVFGGLIACVVLNHILKAMN
jgi:hypothetical protein